MTDGHIGQTSIFPLTHINTHTLTGSFLMEKLKCVIVQWQIKLLFTAWHPLRHRQTRTDRYAHTQALLARRICSYLAFCLLEMLRGHDLSFSHPPPAYMCGWICLSPSVCSFVSVRLVLCLRECDEKRWQRVKMMLKKNQDGERQWETEGRKRGHKSQLFSHCEQAENTQPAGNKLLTVGAAATVCCASFAH